MPRPRKRLTTAEKIEQAEAVVIKRKAEYDEAVAVLKELREKERKENQEALLKAVASSKWSYEKIMEFIQSDPEEADETRGRLEKAGFQVTEMLFDVPSPDGDFNWAYINYLQVGYKIIVPTFGIPEDRQALAYIREANPHCQVKGFRMRDIAGNGGALHCITWNIKKNK